MHVQDIKRWHWALIAIVIGAALAFAWSNTEWDTQLTSMSQREFEMGLTIDPQHIGHIDGITVLPPVNGKYTVRGYLTRQSPKDPSVGEAYRMAYVAPTPYKAGLWRGDDDSYPTVLDYLKKVKADNPALVYHYAWYRETGAMYVLWIATSLLLIGGVWPSIVSLMVGAGLGFHPKEEGPDYDLDRFKGEEAKKPGARPEPTSAEIAHLKQLEEELEAKLAAQRAGLPIPEDSDGAAAGTNADGSPRKLDGGPLEAANLDKPAEDRDYKGEFYPVDRGKKKN